MGARQNEPSYITFEAHWKWLVWTSLRTFCLHLKGSDDGSVERAFINSIYIWTALKMSRLNELLYILFAFEGHWGWLVWTSLHTLCLHLKGTEDCSAELAYIHSVWGTIINTNSVVLFIFKGHSGGLGWASLHTFLQATNQDDGRRSDVQVQP